jgi:hypothetical protein
LTTYQPLAVMSRAIAYLSGFPTVAERYAGRARLQAEVVTCRCRGLKLWFVETC